MTIDEIKALIASDESRTLELKKATGELKDGMHAACAFLNTEGGWLIFGVAPKSLKIVGQQVTDDTKRELAQALAGLEPAYDIPPIYVDVPEYPGNKVIAFHFDGWEWGQKPYTFRGRPYYKIESTTKIMPRDMYDERIRLYHLQTPGQVQLNHRSTTSQPPAEYDPSTTQVSQLITLMGEYYMSLRDIMSLFNLNSAKRFRENYLNPALSDGAIERLYPDQPNHPKQKYRLSEIAKEWKEFNFKS